MKNSIPRRFSGSSSSRKDKQKRSTPRRKSIFGNQRIGVKAMGPVVRQPAFVPDDDIIEYYDDEGDGFEDELLSLPIPADSNNVMKRHREKSSSSPSVGIRLRPRSSVLKNARRSGNNAGDEGGTVYGSIDASEIANLVAGVGEEDFGDEFDFHSLQSKIQQHAQQHDKQQQLQHQQRQQKHEPTATERAPSPLHSQQQQLKLDIKSGDDEVAAMDLDNNLSSKDNDRNDLDNNLISKDNDEKMERRRDKFDNNHGEDAAAMIGAKAKKGTSAARSLPNNKPAPSSLSSSSSSLSLKEINKAKREKAMVVKTNRQMQRKIAQLEREKAELTLKAGQLERKAVKSAKTLNNMIMEISKNQQRNKYKISSSSLGNRRGSRRGKKEEGVLSAGGDDDEYGDGEAAESNKRLVQKLEMENSSLRTQTVAQNEEMTLIAKEKAVLQRRLEECQDKIQELEGDRIFYRHSQRMLSGDVNQAMKNSSLSKDDHDDHAAT
eukprot:jgi/Bigna1/71748/fgenesh1_pg.17_\